MSDMDPRLASRITSLRILPAPRAASAARLHDRLEAEAARVHVQRRIALTPLAAGAAVLMIAALTSLLWLAALRGGDAVAVAAAHTPVQFVLHADGARSVSVVGDFNDWNAAATPMQRSAGGIWSAVVQLTPGPVTYSFLIDGTEWRADPAAPTVRSDFGRPSSVTLVSAPEVET